METRTTWTGDELSAKIPAGSVLLAGELNLPIDARGVVVFAHGSGSSRFSPRNRYVANVLNDANFATLLLDLLIPAEEQLDAYNAHLRFDVALLGRRLMSATDWIATEPDTRHLSPGFFGASTGAAAALIAAAERPEVQAVVSRGGRPDLAGSALDRVAAPTLLIVGGDDYPVIEMNQEALARLTGEKALEIVPGATHLFEEPGTLQHVARLAVDWFDRYLTPARGERHT